MLLLLLLLLFTEARCFLHTQTHTHTLAAAPSFLLSNFSLVQSCCCVTSSLCCEVRLVVCVCVRSVLGDSHCVCVFSAVQGEEEELL